MPITKEKIGWGILGPGVIAREFCECLKQLPDAYVAAVGSRSLERSQAFANTYGGKAYGSYQEMLADPDVDVVYVATPHPMHEEHVIMAANAGKNILCEKPFAVNKKQAENMFAAARKNNVFLMEGLWSRFFPAWQYVKEQLDSGRFGKVMTMRVSTCWGAGKTGENGFPVEDRRVNPDLAGGSLLDAGVYSLAAMTRIIGKFGEPKHVYSTMNFEPTGVDGDVDMLIELDDGVTASLMCSLHRRDMEARIICEKGVITVPVNRNPNRIIIEERAPRPTGKDVPLSQRRLFGSDTITMEFPYRSSGFQFEAEVVQDCLRKGLKICPDVTPEETLMIAGICDTVRAQHNFKYPFED